MIASYIVVNYSYNTGYGVVTLESARTTLVSRYAVPRETRTTYTYCAVLQSNLLGSISVFIER